jgi:hypothetical protein
MIIATLWIATVYIVKERLVFHVGQASFPILRLSEEGAEL